MSGFAPRRTRVAASQTGSQIVGGGSVRIHGFIIHCTGAVQVTFLKNDSTVMFTVSVAANTAFESQIPWLADEGLRITTPASCSVVVFHGAPGA